MELVGCKYNQLKYLSGFKSLVWKQTVNNRVAFGSFNQSVNCLAVSGTHLDGETRIECSASNVLHDQKGVYFDEMTGNLLFKPAKIVTLP